MPPSVFPRRSVPTPARPFSLEAITVPIHSTIQRQLAQDAFSRIIEGLEGSTVRFPTSVNENQVIPLTGSESLPSSSHLSRMKLLTRLTMRRFGGNEFYKSESNFLVCLLRYKFVPIFGTFFKLNSSIDWFKM